MNKKVYNKLHKTLRPIPAFMTRVYPIKFSISDLIRTFSFLLLVSTVQAQNLLNPVMQVLSESGNSTFYEVDSGVLARVLMGDSIQIGNVGFSPEQVETQSFAVRTSSGEDTTYEVLSVHNSSASLLVFPRGEIFFYQMDSLPKVLHKEDDFYVMEIDTSDRGFHCAALSHPEATPSPTDASTLANKVVGVYLEADKAIYDARGGTQGAVNWITSVFEVVRLLYSRESISVKINEIFVWDTQDSYSTSSSFDALQQFKSTRPNHSGDLAHLLALKPTGLGGIAWVNTLCTNYNYAYSNIQNSFANFPTYSWTVMVITHEMGHNLGSPHTQNCSWGPNHNQALDNCYQTEGNCAPGPAPTGGGTIMSYCHLTSYGINMERGFGTEPGDLIRARVSAANCLGEENTCDYPTPQVSNITANSAVITWNSTGIGEYYLRYKPNDATTWTEQGTNVNNFVLDDLIPNTLYALQVRPACQSTYDTEIRFRTSQQEVCGEFVPRGFENEIGFSLGGDINWVRNKGATRSSATGPTQAYEGEYYLYVESSSPNNPNKQAIITSECFEVKSHQALSFAYHMFGSTMGKLEVRLNGVLIFDIGGNQGNQWKTVVIDLPPSTNSVVSFIGTTGNGYRSDIAIDDVKIIEKAIDACAARPGNSSMEWIESIKIGGTLFITGNNNGYLEREITPPLGEQIIEITPGFLREPCGEVFLSLYSEENGSWVQMYQSQGKVPQRASVSLTEGKWRLILSAEKIQDACSEVKWGEIEDYIIR